MPEQQAEMRKANTKKLIFHRTVFAFRPPFPSTSHSDNNNNNSWARRKSHLLSLASHSASDPSRGVENFSICLGILYNFSANAFKIPIFCLHICCSVLNGSIVDGFGRRKRAFCWIMNGISFLLPSPILTWRTRRNYGREHSVSENFSCSWMSKILLKNFYEFFIRTIRSRAWSMIVSMNIALRTIRSIYTKCTFSRWGEISAQKHFLSEGVVKSRRRRRKPSTRP